MMRILTSIHPELARKLDSLSIDQLDAVTLELVKSTWMRFQDVPGVADYAKLCAKGRSYAPELGRKLLEESEQREIRRTELEVAGRQENEWMPIFKQARYAYALHAAAAGVDHTTIHDILYEMAYAHEDEDVFLDDVLQRVDQLLATGRGHPPPAGTC